MTRVMILGSTGMLGHKLVEVFESQVETIAVARRPLPGGSARDLVIDLQDFDAVSEAIHRLRPAAVVNAAGIVKQRRAPAPEMSRINAALPHHLATVCTLVGARLIHLSTDCVFSGRHGPYSEADIPDPVDEYGRTKLQGEILSPNAMVLRTSMIGLEKRHFTGLIEWFLGQTGEVPGFTNAVFSGFSTIELGRIILRACRGEWFRSGIWHVAAPPISKHDLLVRLARKLDRRDIRITPEESVRCDRSLSGMRFEQATGFQSPGWDGMLDGLAEEIRSRKSGNEVGHGL
ncbi:MAG TPA: SDR family oxidoreductase [Alphaproteobacteria bacterium]|nr:SDR family oxidoreductase [Alphaproteobacteria bacterium]